MQRKQAVAEMKNNHSLGRLLSTIHACLALLMADASSAAQRQQEAQVFTVESSVHWVSAYKPEIQLVVRNLTDKRIEFSVNSTAPRSCSEHYPADYIATQLLDLGQLDMPSGVHIVAAGSWSHQNVVVIGGPTAIGCGLLLQVSATEVSGVNALLRMEQVVVIKIGERVRGGTWESQSAPTVKVDHVIENTRFGRADPFSIKLVRLRVTNAEAKPLVFAITDRDISCDRSGSVRWELSERRVTQGLDNGPVEIPAQGWFVFEQAVRTNGHSQGCTLTFNLSVQAEQDSMVKFWQFKSITVPLIASGDLRF